MQALWLEDQQLAVRDLPAPAPGPGEALVRVLQAGICNTDVELTRGYYPFAGVLGHEFVGVVETPGPWQGRRVVGEINVACGQCRQCQSGRRTHCERRTVVGIRGRPGVFAEFVCLPLENLHLVPEALADDEAVFCEPLAAALEILAQVPVQASDQVVVLGDGKLGLLCAQVLAATGCALTVIGRHAGKLEIAARLGLRTALGGEGWDAPADIVVECTGSPEGFEQARRLLRPRGTLVLKSTYAGTLTVDLSRLVVDELTLVGSRCGPFPAALDLLARRAVEVRALIQARYPLAQGPAALARAQAPGVLKVLLEINA